MKPTLFFIVSTAIPTILTLKPPSPPLPHDLITQFPFPTWLENIAVRTNGDILVTTLSSTPNAILYTVQSPSFPSASPIPLHTFTNITSLFGITESSTKPDLFLIAGGNLPTASTPASYFIWALDFQQHPPKTTLIAENPHALLPNGITSIPHRDAILVADSLAGLVWHVNLTTGETTTGIQVPEMAAPPGSPPDAIGINGVKIHKGYLYWSHSSLASIFRVRINKDGRRDLNAPVETVARLDATFLDDFVIEPDGIIWAATNSDSTLVAVDIRTGKSEVVLGGKGEMTVAGATAVAPGRGKGDEGAVYVVTCGGLRRPVNGTVVEGGKVARVDTRGFKFG
ncbi:hypothetical protein B0T14DRAFT_530799 [Immersiella caudata]|uniref:SMP-30/Gluconolactonase/LRE-like region domain-containing protein n=1 Tax=Immersiella caudata TaxID=314043 RepID=A0AA39U3E5_9PEZI|nr:hypothetical protein B0T14DRAFT_530799 [Immersiella caudata]